MSEQRTALVTGANRGIALEVCRQLAAQGLRVILTSCDPAKADAAARALGSAGNLRRTFDTNVLGAVAVSQAFAPGVIRPGRLHAPVGAAATRAQVFS